MMSVYIQLICKHRLFLVLINTSAFFFTRGNSIAQLGLVYLHRTLRFVPSSSFSGEKVLDPLLSGFEADHGPWLVESSGAPAAGTREG